MNPKKPPAAQTSLRSYAFYYVKEYTSAQFDCWRCSKSEVFTAAGQKYAYEVRKAYIHAKRNLCTACWKQSNDIARRLEAFERRWLESRDGLARDADFLEQWLELLILREEYLPYRPDSTRKNMIVNALARLQVQGQVGQSARVPDIGALPDLTLQLGVSARHPSKT